MLKVFVEAFFDLAWRWYLLKGLILADVFLFGRVPFCLTHDDNESLDVIMTTMVMGIIMMMVLRILMLMMVRAMVLVS